MRVTRRQFVGGAGVTMAMLLAACGAQEPTEQTEEEATAVQEGKAESSLTLDSSAWNYNEDDDVYYQLGISYCEKPASEEYEQLAILVPGAYFAGTSNGDGTYTCEVSESGTVGSFNAKTAPIVMPINTPGYSAQSPMSEYSSQTAYTSAGYVYVHAGCRGRDAGAPAGVTDLKAAVRFLRFVQSQIAGDAERIFTFGMSGGGAQSALMGSTGDASLYEPYLDEIGAVGGVSDAVLGSMDWCPITGLDVADEAYEWMMGCTRADLSEEEQQISNGLAESFAAWINGAGLVDDDGSVLELTESGEGVYQAGSYYEKVRATIEESLNNFLADTEFPYDASSSNRMGGMSGGGAPGGQMPQDHGDGGPGNGEFDGQRPDGLPEGADGSDGMANSEQRDNISRTQTTGGISLSGTYDTASAYIDALNANAQWVTYDEANNTASITNVADFCTALKQASKSLAAFDQLDRGQGENTLFGTDGNPLHFDERMAEVLGQIGSSYASDYESDLGTKDAVGNDVATRVKMYTPLYYLLASEEGYGGSTPAKHWRIRTGINQGDTALSTELNLALALKADKRVESVDFATVWGQGHTQAERTGSAEENFVTWVASCLASK